MFSCLICFPVVKQTHEEQISNSLDDALMKTLHGATFTRKKQAKPATSSISCSSLINDNGKLRLPDQIQTMPSISDKNYIYSVPIVLNFESKKITCKKKQNNLWNSWNQYVTILYFLTFLLFICFLSFFPYFSLVFFIECNTQNYP